MSWIKLAVAGFALCAGASVASAQGAPPAGAQQGAERGGQGRGGRGMQMLFEGLTLTDAQQKQVQDISTKYRAQMQEAMPNGMGGGPPDPAARAKMDEIRTRQYAEIRGVLTADQQATFDKNVETMKKRREQMQRPNGGS